MPKKDDNVLRMTTKPIYEYSFDTGGMFNARSLVYFDDTEGCALPYLALVVDGWDGGRGKRHATKEEAVRDLERLSELMFG